MLNLKQLKNVVRQVKDEEKQLTTLKTEIRRVMGPIMDTSSNLERLAEQVNDRVSVMNRTGRSSHLDFKPSSVLPYVNHRNPEVRAMAANLLPNQMLGRLSTDPHSMVRAVVAQRAELSTVKEMMRRFPRDDGLRSIYKNRRKQLNEDGIAKPKVDDEPFDMYGDEPLGDAVKQGDVPDLTDEWYHQQAFKLIQMYDKTLERSWEENAVNALVKHTKATSGIEIDHQKLLDAVFKQLDESDDEVMEKSSLKELAFALRGEADVLDEATACYTDVSDDVLNLVESALTPTEYLSRADTVFQVRKSTVPTGIKKHRLGTLSEQHMVPMKAALPHGRAPRAIDEHALDLYVKYWNERQAMMGEPIKINWTSHPSEESSVGFSCTLR